MWGILATIIAGGTEFGLEYLFSGLFTEPLLQIFITAFVFVAFIEEYLKYLIVKKKAYTHPAFNEHYDGIIYGVVASLGFAALENILYVTDGGFSVGIIRAMLSVPAHALFGATMGYYFGLARFEKGIELKKQLLKKGLFLSIFWHGIYDFLLMTASAFSFLVIPMLLGLYINIRRKIAHLHTLDKAGNPLKPFKVKDYIKIFLGMICFTMGALIILTILLFATADPAALTSFNDLEFNYTYTSIFAIVMFLISRWLIRIKT